MNAKKYLSENIRLQELYDAKLNQIKELRLMCDCIKSPMDGSEKVQSSNISNKTHELVCKILTLEEELKDNLNELINKNIDITNKINGLGDQEYKLLLSLRYLHFMTWEEISCKMGITFQWTHILHKRALKSFSEHYGGTNGNMERC